MIIADDNVVQILYVDIDYLSSPWEKIYWLEEEELDCILSATYQTIGYEKGYKWTGQPKI